MWGNRPCDYQKPTGGQIDPFQCGCVGGPSTRGLPGASYTARLRRCGPYGYLANSGVAMIRSAEGIADEESD